MKHRTHHCDTLKGRPGTEMENDVSSGRAVRSSPLPSAAEAWAGAEPGQEPCFLPEPTWTQKKTIFAPLQNSSFFSRVPISYHFEEEAGFGADSGCLPRPASEEAVSSPTFQGTHKGLIKN